MTDSTDRPTSESPVGLVGDVVAGFARLVRGEFALANAEVKRSLGDATSGLAKLAVAAVLGITALNVLAGAAVAGLVAAGLTPLWASVALGAGLLAVVYVIVQIALAQLKPANLAPKRVFSNLRHDAKTLKSMVTSDATSNHRP
jgi:hypothetical protein